MFFKALCIVMMAGGIGGLIAWILKEATPSIDPFFSNEPPKYGIRTVEHSNGLKLYTAYEFRGGYTNIIRSSYNLAEVEAAIVEACKPPPPPVKHPVAIVEVIEGNVTYPANAEVVYVD